MDDFDRIRRVQFSYDEVAEEYAARISDELRHKPFDRQLLDRFAERVRPLGAVCDLGCGPGHAARYLRDRSVDVFGLDLSEQMIAVAQRLHPDIRFVQGNMLSLELESDQLGGIVALYSIIHLERPTVPRALAEMKRVLQPGGLLLLAFHIGTDEVHRDEWWGHPVSLEAVFFGTDEVRQYVESAGMRVEETLERDPYPEVEYQSRRGYILASNS